MGLASKLVLLSALCLACTHMAEAVPKSRFVKDVDERKLDEEWKDEDEDDSWHEDTFEWKQKMAKKKAPALDLAALQAGGGGGGANAQEKVLEHEALSGNMQMAFATLKKGVTSNQHEAEEIGRRWQAMMQTAGINTHLYAISQDDLLFTDDNGVIIKVRDFVLEQPECEKFRWKDTDFDKAWLAKKKATAAAAEAEEKARLLKQAKKDLKKKAKAKAKGKGEKEGSKKGGKKGKKGSKKEKEAAAAAEGEAKAAKKSRKGGKKAEEKAAAAEATLAPAPIAAEAPPAAAAAATTPAPRTEL